MVKLVLVRGSQNARMAYFARANFVWHARINFVDASICLTSRKIFMSILSLRMYVRLSERYFHRYLLYIPIFVFTNIFRTSKHPHTNKNIADLSHINQIILRTDG